MVIGPSIHEDPHVPHFGLPNKGLRLKPGMVITIEPMLNEGDWRSKVDSNNWTARTIDGGRSAQYEHTIVITRWGSDNFDRTRSVKRNNTRDSFVKNPVYFYRHLSFLYQKNQL